MLVAVIVAACAETTFSTDANDYIPAEIGGREVTTEGARVESIQESFATGQVDSAATGLVLGDDEKVELMLVAVVGPEETADEIRINLLGTMTVMESDDHTEVEVSGIDAKIYEGNARGEKISIGVADPEPGIQLITIAFAGGDAAAESGLDAMIAAGG